ncbi:N-terminal acetyltransferase B complex catalytic subunit NAA20 isoform X1 [Macadamia integrifolia]|uniref:N-terminal acetyltransferase B complex catalytic subunit NAA20 isoform X1 n=1 Tax=Macadamia integrifolia TaxID=60698 RepID=UPI001C4F9AAE|nr:N-terminal acetyltransferase B complex catalytic subunit NAA20 isoform X1 [Macadamia integrifolia]
MFPSMWHTRLDGYTKILLTKDDPPPELPSYPNEVEDPPYCPYPPPYPNKPVFLKDSKQVMGKVEGQGESWHGHVTAVTVAPEFRRQQLAKKLMHLLEDISDKIDKAYFVDLFVRASNTPAIKMYEKLGYVIYRRVLRYYSGEEDGLDMRKALSRDVEKKSIIPLKRPVTPDELEYD